MNSIRPISFNRLPPATRWIILACGTGYALQLVFGGAVNGVFGLVPFRVVNDGWLWQAASYMFLHGGLFHLFFNMLMLWMFGRIIESELGQKEFVKYFFITGVGAAFFSVLLSYNSRVPIIGASGAIYGLLVAFAMLYPKATVYLYFVFPITARQMAVICVFLEFMASFSSKYTGIANFAHLGGMLTGYLYLRNAAKRSEKQSPFQGPQSGARIRMPPDRAASPRRGSIEEEVNRILDKILVKGMDSLTEEELVTMKKYSSQIKK